MKIFKEQPLKFIIPVFGVLLSISLSVVCFSTKNYSASKKQDSMTGGSSINADTSVSSGYYLSLGVLDHDVVRDGAGRNKPEVAVNGKNIVFPKGSIKSISIKSWAREEKAYNPPEAGIIQYMDALESARIVDAVPENVLEGMVKIDTHIIYLNSNGKFRTINVTSFGNGYHEISVEKDDTENFSKKVSIKSRTGKKYRYVFLRSKKAEKIIKKWLNWEKQGKKGFSHIQSASLSYDRNTDRIKLPGKHLDVLKKYLAKCKKTNGAPCGYENYFECVQNDGRQFHFSISSDGESISTDKGVYMLDYPDNKKIVKLFKKIRQA